MWKDSFSHYLSLNQSPGFYAKQKTIFRMVLRNISNREFCLICPRETLLNKKLKDQIGLTPMALIFQQVLNSGQQHLAGTERVPIHLFLVQLPSTVMYKIKLSHFMCYLEYSLVAEETHFAIPLKRCNLRPISMLNYLRRHFYWRFFFSILVQ